MVVTWNDGGRVVDTVHSCTDSLTVHLYRQSQLLGQGLTRPDTCQCAGDSLRVNITHVPMSHLRVYHHHQQTFGHSDSGSYVTLKWFYVSYISIDQLLLIRGCFSEVSKYTRSFEVTQGWDWKPLKSWLKVCCRRKICDCCGWKINAISQNFSLNLSVRVLIWH